MKYYVIAGEASGDLHGANLMAAIRRQDPSAEFRFWGGDHMAAVGGTPVRHISSLSIMGFIEVATHMRSVLGNIAFCKKDILQYRPDAMVFVDYPGFNLRIAKFTRQHGLRNFYYISPMVWAWKKGRIKKMRPVIDKLYYILPFERNFFAHNYFQQAVYVGHPLLDEAAKYPLHPAPSSSAEGERHLPLVALLPGSRKQELAASLPAMLHVAGQHPEYQFEIAGMSLLGRNHYLSFLKEAPKNVLLKLDQTYNILSRSYAAIVCSGTATLEACLFGVPQVVCYRANAASAAIARHLLKVRYISLVNLVMNRRVVTELVQEHFTFPELEQEFRRLTQDDGYRTKMLEDYEEVKRELGGVGASERTARDIVAELQKPNP
ncbi:MAG: lipid-A-disaccharide synthase [Bacteroidales bacterium]|nr:lipid-A-disaccharide synthase [Bacteroidales bacterium]